MRRDVASSQASCAATVDGSSSSPRPRSTWMDHLWLTWPPRGTDEQLGRLPQGNGRGLDGLLASPLRARGWARGLVGGLPGAALHVEGKPAVRDCPEPL